MHRRRPGLTLSPRPSVDESNLAGWLAWFRSGLQHPLERNDDIFHFGVVDRPLGGGTPCVFSRFEVGEDADEIDAVEIDEVEGAGVGDATAENEMQAAHDIPSNARVSGFGHRLSAMAEPHKT